MIIVNLKGGLGNQMFQYALGRKLALQNNKSLKLDTSGYPRQTLRQYGLGVFKIEEKIASPAEINKLKYPYGLFSMAWRRFSFKILRRFHTGWEPTALAKKGDFYLDGFWQSYKYFADIADTIRNDFTLKEPLEAKYPDLVRQVRAENSLSLHIRRTDYLSSPKHFKKFGALGLDYYRPALEKIKAIHPDLTVFIFTDDPTWVKDNLVTGLPTVFVADFVRRDYEELALMSYCRHHIIANSSFSWWGAWLDPRPDKIVIAPVHWTQSGEPKTDDIIEPAWTKI